MTVPLIPPGSEVGFLGEAAIPADLYFVARQPAPLIGMGFPARVDWQLMWDIGVRHVVCLTHDDAAPYDSGQVQTHAIALQDLYCEPVGPRNPATERTRIERAGRIASDAILAGEGVAVHCRGGRGRAGTVLGVTLTNLGHRPADVVSYLDRLHRARGKDGWPECPWQSATILQQQ